MGEDIKIKKGNRGIIKIIIISIIILVVLGLGALSFYFYSQYKKASNELNSTAKDEVSVISRNIGKFMELPNETPTLATVTDKEKLQDQVFFQNAQNGDKVLIYSQAQKAILYRPSTSKVVEVTSLISKKQEGIPAESDSQGSQEETEEQANVPEQSESPVPSQDEEKIIKKARVTVYNGTTTKGLAKSLGEKISMLEGVESVSTGNAIKNYSKNIVVDLTGDNSDLSNSIVEAISGEIGDLPEGEKKPDADILVIGGKI